MTETRSGAGRRQLIIMLLIAGTSLGGSWALFLFTRDGTPWGTTNNGTFVNPPVVVSTLGLTDSDGVPVSDDPTWWIWVVQPGACDGTCEDALHQLRQLHVLLHRDADRVRRALVTRERIEPGELAALYPELVFLSGNVSALVPGIYLVDPHGNLVLQYPLEAAGKPVLEDLKRLLKVSQIG